MLAEATLPCRQHEAREEASGPLHRPMSGATARLATPDPKYSLTSPHRPDLASAYCRSRIGIRGRGTLIVSAL